MRNSQGHLSPSLLRAKLGLLPVWGSRPLPTPIPRYTSYVCSLSNRFRSFGARTYASVWGVGFCFWWGYWYLQCPVENLRENNQFEKINKTGLPWWLSGKESACQCRRHGFDPWSGKIPSAMKQLSPGTTTTEP